jgi:hypothetical protein
MYQFDNQGNLKGYANKNQRYLSNLMLKRGILTSEDTIGQHGVYVSGNARSYLNIVKIQDSTAVPLDSLSIKIEDEEFDF